MDLHKTWGTIEFISDDLSSIINKNARLEKIVDGCQFTEGPLWLEKEKMLLFSDVPANTIYKWTKAHGKEVYLKQYRIQFSSYTIIIQIKIVCFSFI